MATIYALASARGRAGVAVIRISGPQAHAALRAFCGDLPRERIAALRHLVHEGTLLDEALVLMFREGASFTGEDVVELHVHGGSAVVRAVLQALSTMPGLRQAEPGEFTRRALENGRIDLAQVEGLADLIDAETEAQRRQAMRVLDGAIARQVTLWRSDLVQAMALLEAVIDFSEEDLPAGLIDDVETTLRNVLDALEAEAAGYGSAERLREGFEVALVGPPNVGKSTLLNALARRDAALTSPVAGTTRDVIEVRMDLNGLPVTFLDTAGIRDTVDSVEFAGINRTIVRARAADLRVFLLNDAADVAALQPLPGDLVVLAKADLNPPPDGLWGVSGLTGEGIDKIIAFVVLRLSEQTGSAGIVIHERHRVAVNLAILHLKSALDCLASQSAVELAADDLRLCVRALESLIGKVDTEQLLGHIFGRFCIGK